MGSVRFRMDGWIWSQSYNVPLWWFLLVGLGRLGHWFCASERLLIRGEWHFQWRATTLVWAAAGARITIHQSRLCASSMVAITVTSTGSPDPSLSGNCIACSWIAFLKSHQSLYVMEFSAEKWQENELSFQRIQQSFRIEVVRSFSNPTPFSNLPPNLWMLATELFL